MATRRIRNDENGATAPGDGDGGEEWRVPVAPVTSRETIEGSTAALDDDDPDALAERFASLIGQSAGERMIVKLYRVDPRTGRLAWCEDMTPHQIDSVDALDNIRKAWGSGEFEFRLIGSQGIKMRRRQVVAARPDVPALPAPASSHSFSDPLADALARIAEGQAAILQTLARRPDEGSEIRRMTELATLMRTIAPAPAPSPSVDMVGMMSAMFGLLKDAKATMREISDDVPPEPADPIMASLPKLVDLVSRASSPAPAEPARVIAPASLVENRARHVPEPIATEVAPAPDPLPETPEQMMLRGEIEDLCDMAKRGEPPEKGGERIAERLPDELLDYMQNRYWFEIVAQLFPIIREHEDWLRKAKAHADIVLSQPDDDAD